MKKIISLIGGICGIISGIYMIVAAIMDGNVPKTLWLVIAIGYIITTLTNIYHYRSYCKKEK